jgi:AcrR family transcriptional regulator
VNAKKHDSEEPACSVGARPGARERVVDAACSLFYRKGIRAVGVESIAEEADTTKMSLYRYFPSKDELVAEWLRRAHEAYLNWWDEQIRPYAGDPRRQLTEIFARHAEKMAEPESRGCAVANAAVEITDPDHPGREVIEQHKTQVRNRLFALCAALDVQDPQGLCDGLFLLLEGARASVQSLGCEGPCSAFAQTAEALVAAHESQPRKRVGKARVKA